MSKLVCPKCGSTKNTVLCLTSNPPQFEYYCGDCGWPLKISDRNNLFLPISQSKLNSTYKISKNEIQAIENMFENKVEIKIRAIYIGDVRFDDCPVFELDVEDGYFKIIGDPEFRYPKEMVEKDKNFIRFEVDGESVKRLNN